MHDAAILVISDSHGNLGLLKTALKWAAVQTAGGAADFRAAFFLGDGLADLDAASAETGFGVPWYAVRGNSDAVFLRGSPPDTLVPEIAGRTFFLAHGNRYAVDGGFETIAAAALDAGAEAALFGHTHAPFCGRSGGVFLLNPGSIGRPRTRAGPAFAVLTVPETGPITAEFRGIDGAGTVKRLALP